MTATQKTARMLLAKNAMRPMARSGASKAPAVSNACLRPKARPRISGAVSSAIIASRGEPRTPFPIRSANRASMIIGALLASGNNGFDRAARP